MRQGYPLDASSPSFRSVPILMNRYLFQTGARRFVCCFSLPIRADRLQPRCHSACSSSSAPDGRYEESWRRAKRLIGTDTVLSSAEQTRFCEWLEMNNKRTWVFLGFRRRKKKKGKEGFLPVPGFCGVLGFFCFSKHANVIPMKIRFGDCWVPLFVRVLKINGKACAPGPGQGPGPGICCWHDRFAMNKAVKSY